MRGSRGFHAASEQIVASLKQYGLADAHIESLPADGKIFYGTQRSRPAWNADFAELWDGDTRLASWDAAPITLAQDSASADVTALSTAMTTVSFAPRGTWLRTRSFSWIRTRNSPLAAYSLCKSSSVGM